MGVNRWYTSDATLNKAFLLKVSYIINENDEENNIVAFDASDGRLKKNDSEYWINPGDYFNFDCTSKSIPVLEPVETVSIQFDDLPLGSTFFGVPSGVKEFEISTPTPVSSTMCCLQSCILAGAHGTVKMVYEDDETNQTATITLKECRVVDINFEGGDSNSSFITNIKFKSCGGSVYPTTTITNN